MDASNNDTRKPYSIGYVTKVTGVNASTLRSWEQQGLIEPAKSGGGRRTFGNDDIARIQEIERLRRIYGYSLAGVKRALAETDAAKNGSDSAAPTGDQLRLDLIGARVRALRTEAGLSLRALAERTGITASHLSMFERGVAFPSPSRLNTLARVFNRTIADLIGGTDTHGRTVVRKGQGRIVGSFGPGVTVEQLTVSEQLMDCEIWTIQGGMESDGFYAHEGQELIHLLEGELELTLEGEKPEILRAGDSAYFNSTRQHRWRNPGTGLAVAIWVNTDTNRLAALEQNGAHRRINLGARIGNGVGEPGLALQLPADCRTYRVVDTHTAGHPTRVLLEPLEGLTGQTVREKRDEFRHRHDDLRPLLLHEPRGHAATFGLVPVQSSVADFGAFFTSSYDYPDICVHGIIGYARVLESLGRLANRSSFRLEVPAGIVAVHLGHDGDRRDVSVDLPPSRALSEPLALPEIAAGCKAMLAYGGAWYANVDATDLGLPITPDGVTALLEVGGRIKDAVNARLAGGDLGIPAVEGALFHQTLEPGRIRQIAVLDRTKFDRSPCGTGAASRLAELAVSKRLAIGDRLVVENVHGLAFTAEVLATIKTDGGPAIVPRITGRANLVGFATLILEADDPFSQGFLCR